jgi:hypothetical protein
LWDFKQVQQHLTADTLKRIIKVDPTPHALKREPPGIDGFCRGNFRRFFS